jgi:heat shock protein HslJ
MDFEADYLQTLSEVKSFESSADTMTLKNESGEAILVFRK